MCVLVRVRVCFVCTCPNLVSFGGLLAKIEPHQYSFSPFLFVVFTFTPASTSRTQKHTANKARKDGNRRKQQQLIFSAVITLHFELRTAEISGQQTEAELTSDCVCAASAENNRSRNENDDQGSAQIARGIRWNRGNLLSALNTGTAVIPTSEIESTLKNKAVSSWAESGLAWGTQRAISWNRRRTQKTSSDYLMMFCL